MNGECFLHEWLLVNILNSKVIFVLIILSFSFIEYCLSLMKHLTYMFPYDVRGCKQIRCSSYVDFYMG